MAVHNLISEGRRLISEAPEFIGKQWGRLTATAQGVTRTQSAVFSALAASVVVAGLGTKYVVDKRATQAQEPAEVVANDAHDEAVPVVVANDAHDEAPVELSRLAKVSQGIQGFMARFVASFTDWSSYCRSQVQEGLQAGRDLVSWGWSKVPSVSFPKLSNPFA